MVALASAYIRLRPQVDQREYQKAGEQAGKAAGDSAGKGIKGGIDKGLDEARVRAAKSGGEAGAKWGEGFHRDSQGKIRDAQGKFVQSSIASGDTAGKGFAKSFGKGSSGIVGAIKSNIGAAAGIFVPLGLAAAVGQIGKIGMAYEDNLNVFKQVSKATGAQMAAVAEQARALGADIQLPGVSAAGAAAAMTELAKAGFSVDEAMAAAKGTLQLARVAAISEADAAEIAANAVNAFGIAAGDTGFVVDELAAAANSSSISVTEASASFKQAAAVFSGVQSETVGAKEAITELNTAVAILGNNGIKGSDAGTSLKQMLLQLTGPSQQAKAQMALLAQAAAGANISLEQQNAVLYGSKAIRDKASAAIAKSNAGMKLEGDIAYDAAGRMRPLRDIIGLVTAGTKNMTQEDRNYAITQIFGADASRAVLALMKGGLPVYDAQRKAVMETGAAAANAAAQNAGLKGAIDNVKSQIENAAIAIYNVVRGPLTTGLNNFAAALPGIFNGIKNTVAFLYDNKEAILAVAYAYGTLTLAVKASAAANAIAAAGGIVPFLIKYANVVRAATIGQVAFNVALIANPIGITVIAIAALVAGFVIAYKKSETFRNIVQGALNGIKVAAMAVADFFMTKVLPTLKATWDGIATGAIWLYQNVIKPVFSLISKVFQVWWAGAQIIFAAFMAYLRNVVFPVINFLYQNVVKPIFSAIKKAVEVWWLAVRIVFAAFKLYLTNVLIPAIKFLYENGIKPTFALIGKVISVWYNNVAKPIFAGAKAAFTTLGVGLRAVYETIIRPMFQKLSTFISGTVAPGFKKGVDAIRAAWDKVKEAARTPVAFVVNKVINPFITGLNAAAKVVGVKDRVEPIKGFASGGQIPGMPSNHDNRMAYAQGGMPIKVATGEFITNTKSTLANLPLVKAINRKKGKVQHADVDKYIDGYEDGGIVGFFKKVINGAKGVGNFIADPSEGLTKIATSLLGKMPGADTGFGRMIAGSASKVIRGAGSWLKDKLTFGGGGGDGASFGKWPSSPGAQRGDSGVWRRIVNLIKATGPMSGSFGNGYRPGDPLWHGSGRAVDWMGFGQDRLATYLANMKPLELIHRTNNRDYAYTRGRNKGSFNNQLMQAHRNHVHIAFKDGGLIPGMPVRRFDQGGAWPSGTLGVNTSGRTEYVDPNKDGMRGGVTIVIKDSVISSEKHAEDLVVRGWQAAKRHKRIP